MVSAAGGCTGVYIKSKGKDGDGQLIISSQGLEPVKISMSVECLN